MTYKVVDSKDHTLLQGFKSDVVINQGDFLTIANKGDIMKYLIVARVVELAAKEPFIQLIVIVKAQTKALIQRKKANG